MTTTSLFITKSKSDKDKAIELDNWSLLDVHKWSEYQEINQAVDLLIDEFSQIEDFKGKAKVQKRHIKVVVLDLYVKWFTDPEMYIGYYRMKGKYTKLDDRYNKLHIKFTTVKIVDALASLGLVDHVKGHYFKDGSGQSHMSRMRASTRLAEEFFVRFNFTPEMVEKAPNTECIILRDKDEDENNNIDISYKDEERTIQMREHLYAYNNLLRSSRIEIPDFPREGISTRNKKHRIRVNFHDKFVRRIFNNGSWEQGGRFYGGFWQRLPKEWRVRIRINSLSCVEQDYSGLHIMLLYKMKGLDYWQVIGGDPYTLEGCEHSERMRDFLKLVLLIAINASNMEEFFKALTRKQSFEKDKYGWIEKEGVRIGEVIDAFEQKHEAIREYFTSGMGISLQYYDSLMAEYVINHFTQKNIPILCIHDSFIIPNMFSDSLERVMQDAYIAILESLDLEPSTTIVKLSLGPEEEKPRLLSTNIIIFKEETEQPKLKLISTSIFPQPEEYYGGVK